MQALTFWKTIIMDQSNFLEQFIAALEGNQIRYCVIGGQGINAYVDPLVSLDLDLVIASDQIDEVEALLAAGNTQIKRFAHSLNASFPGSSLRLQIRTDPRYATFPQRAARRQVLGLSLPVAAASDLLRGKVWAFQDPARRGSKRQKDWPTLPGYSTTIPSCVLKCRRTYWRAWSDGFADANALAC